MTSYQPFLFKVPDTVQLSFLNSLIYALVGNHSMCNRMRLTPFLSYKLLTVIWWSCWVAGFSPVMAPHEAPQAVQYRCLPHSEVCFPTRMKSSLLWWSCWVRYLVTIAYRKWVCIDALPQKGVRTSCNALSGIGTQVLTMVSPIFYHWAIPLSIVRDVRIKGRITLQWKVLKQNLFILHKLHQL